MSTIWKTQGKLENSGNLMFSGNLREFCNFLWKNVEGQDVDILKNVMFKNSEFPYNGQKIPQKIFLGLRRNVLLHCSKAYNVIISNSKSPSGKKARPPPNFINTHSIEIFLSMPPWGAYVHRIFPHQIDILQYRWNQF